MQSRLSTAEVVKLSGASYRQIDHWTRNGVLPCTVEANGPGTARVYTLRQAAVARVFMVLTNLGCGSMVLRLVAQQLDVDHSRWVLSTVRPTGEVEPVGRVDDLSTGWLVDLAEALMHVARPDAVCA